MFKVFIFFIMMMMSGVVGFTKTNESIVFTGIDLGMSINDYREIDKVLKTPSISLDTSLGFRFEGYSDQFYWGLKENLTYYLKKKKKLQPIMKRDTP